MFGIQKSEKLQQGAAFWMQTQNSKFTDKPVRNLLLFVCFLLIIRNQVEIYLRNVWTSDIPSSSLSFLAVFPFLCCREKAEPALGR